MSDAPAARSHGKVFDAIAAEYDANRPAYPAELIEQAIEVAGLRAGDPVLELGAGTGKLTRALVAHVLRVTAVEPGENLIAVARESLRSDGSLRTDGSLGGSEVEFVQARLEDAELPADHFKAAFAAASFHWMDPDVSWRLVAAALTPGGTFGLIGHIDVAEPWSESDSVALRAAIERVAPAWAALWPPHRSVDAIVEGVRERAANISRAWDWLSAYDLARDYAEALFEPAELAAVPVRFEHTATEVNAVLATMSFWASLTAAQREELEQANERLYERTGRPIRSSTLAVLVTARRRHLPGRDAPL